MGRDYLTAILCRWGWWMHLQMDHSGYPTSCTLSRLMEGGGVRPGSRVLIRDMPPDVWRTQFVVLTLPDTLQRTLLAEYSAPPAPDGRFLDRRRLAEACGCSVQAYKKRLYRARKAVARGLDVST